MQSRPFPFCVSISIHSYLVPSIHVKKGTKITQIIIFISAWVSYLHDFTGRADWMDAFTLGSSTFHRFLTSLLHGLNKNLYLYNGQTSSVIVSAVWHCAVSEVIFWDIPTPSSLHWVTTQTSPVRLMLPRRHINITHREWYAAKRQRDNVTVCSCSNMSSALLLGGFPCNYTAVIL